MGRDGKWCLPCWSKPIYTKFEKSRSHLITDSFTSLAEPDYSFISLGIYYYTIDFENYTVVSPTVMSREFYLQRDVTRFSEG